MRSVFILAMFGMLLLQPGASSAETFDECRTRCSAEMTSSTGNCPPLGDESRTYCLTQENQEVLNVCLDSCPQAEPVDMPEDTTDTPKDAPVDIPQDTSDTPKEN